MAVMKYPRLYEKDQFSKIVYPVSVSIQQNITPLSTATISLPKGEGLPARSYVELFTPYGSAGMYRVRSPRDAYGYENTTAELEHMISEVGDYVVKEETSEMMAADAAMKRAFSYYKGGRWKLGTVSAIGTGKIAFEAKYDRVLDVMLTILQQKPDCMLAYDFSTKPWTVSVVRKGTTVSAEGRLARNVTSASVSYDDSELCTRVWYQTYTNGQNPKWVSKDANVSKYGIVEGTVRTSADMTNEEINQTVDTFLKEHKNPRVSVNIQAVELCQITGESLDRVEVGKLYRLNMPDYDFILEDVITSIVWNDVYGDPMSVTVNLGADEDTVVTFLHNLDAKGSGGGGGGGAKDKQEKAWSAYHVEWNKNEENVTGLVSKSNEFGNILEQAGLELNSQGLLVYANTTNGLYHQFDVLNNQFNSKITNAQSELQSEIDQVDNKVSLVVSGTGKNAKIKAAQIVAAINDGSSSILLSADHIDMDGLVRNLQSENLTVGDITSEGSITADQDITADGTVSGLVGSFNELIAHDREASWQSLTVVTSVTRSASRNFVYARNGNISDLDTIIGTLVTGVSSDAIYYLGR